GRVPGMRVAIPALVIMLVCGIAAYTLGMPFTITKLAWGGVGAACILALVGPIGSALHHSPLERFGARSYSFYLLHQPILLLLAGPASLLPGGWIGQLFVGGAIAFALVSLAATVLYRTVEKPSHEYAQRRFAPRSSPPPAEIAVVEETS